MCHVFPYTIKTAVTQRNENGRNVKVLEKSQRFKMFLFRQSTYWFPLTCSLIVRKGQWKELCKTLWNTWSKFNQAQSLHGAQSSQDLPLKRDLRIPLNEYSINYHKLRTEISNWIFATTRNLIPGLSRIGTGVMFLFPLASASTHLAKYIYQTQVLCLLNIGQCFSCSGG